MTPKEFAKKMEELERSENPIDIEIRHMEADKIMIMILTDLGYGEGAKIFENMYKWYS